MRIGAAGIAERIGIDYWKSGGSEWNLEGRFTGWTDYVIKKEETSC
jgi:hypothetical protein